MPYHFTCPTCRSAMSVEGSLTGYETSCPSCGSPVWVPAPPFGPDEEPPPGCLGPAILLAAGLALRLLLGP